MLKVPKPFDSFLKELTDLCRQYAFRQARKLSDLPQEALLDLLRRYKHKSQFLNQQIEACYQTLITLCSDAIKGSHITLEVEGKEINYAKASSSSTLITGTIKFAPHGTFKLWEVKCYLAYGNWKKLGEIRHTDKINLIDYLPKLLPEKKLGTQQGPIGLVTCQNGIMNDFENDFKTMCQIIIDQFPEGPLFIGLHNATTNILPLDMRRFIAEPLLNANSVYSFCQMMKTFTERLPKINPNMVWVHFAHSEGCLIANAALSLCDQEWYANVRKYLKDHMVIATYGAVKPVPDEPVLEVVNTYSKKDIALFFGSFFLDKPLEQITEENYISTKQLLGKTYRVTIIDSQLPFEAILKMNLDAPEIMSLKERMNLSWMEWIANYMPPPEPAEMTKLLNVTNKTILDRINESAHAIMDHGFAELSYKGVLEDNIDTFKQKYKVYHANER